MEHYGEIRHEIQPTLPFYAVTPDRTGGLGTANKGRKVSQDDQAFDRTVRTLGEVFGGTEVKYAPRDYPMGDLFS